MLIWNDYTEFEVIFCVHGVISPILANVYLHEVLDKWFERDVLPCRKGFYDPLCG